MTERRWYLLFNSEVGTLVAVMGPFKNAGAASTVMEAMLAVDELAVRALDLDSVPPAAQCIPDFYSSIKMLDLSVEEVEKL